MRSHVGTTTALPCAVLLVTTERRHRGAAAAVALQQPGHAAPHATKLVALPGGSVSACRSAWASLNKSRESCIYYRQVHVYAAACAFRCVLLPAPEKQNVPLGFLRVKIAKGHRQRVRTCWPCGFPVRFDDAGGAALWFRQFISVPFLDGSKRYVSQAQVERRLAKTIDQFQVLPGNT